MLTEVETPESAVMAIHTAGTVVGLALALRLAEGKQCREEAVIFAEEVALQTLRGATGLALDQTALGNAVDAAIAQASNGDLDLRLPLDE